MAASPTSLGYNVVELRNGWAVVEVYAGGFGRCIIERGIGCEAEADHLAQELADRDREEAFEAAEAADEYGTYDVRRAA